MTRVNTHIRSLLGAKDITRAIGLMIVLVFVTAVGGVSLVSFLNQRATARVQRTDALSSALQLLSDRLEPALVLMEQAMRKGRTALPHGIQFVVFWPSYCGSEVFLEVSAHI